MFETPVLLLIFNRPDCTRVVFNEIRKRQPKHLYIAADGPRINNPNDSDLCKECRKIVDAIDWDCDVQTLFRSGNLGSKYAVSSGISWFLEHEKLGIILEDDCLPNQSFFSFCEQLLTDYEHDDQIMHITGTNLNDKKKYGDGSYYYSRYPNVWGWATWRRAWQKMDLELRNEDEYFTLINKLFKYKSEKLFWMSRIGLIKSNKIDAWDYQWMLSIWKANGLCLNTNFNLVTNIGFDSNGTHTKGESLYITPERTEIAELQHPAARLILDKAETDFIKLLHGVIRRGDFNYFIHTHFIQRCFNLIHKLKLLFTPQKPDSN
jgi:hypothetical protein